MQKYIEFFPISLGYSSPGRNLFTFDEAELSTTRKILIKDVETNWYKFGFNDPYLEFNISNVKKGDVYKLEFEVLTDNTQCTVLATTSGVYYYNRIVEKNVFNKIEQLVHIENDSSLFVFNIRGLTINSIVKNVRLTVVRGTKEFRVDKHTFKNQGFVVGLKYGDKLNNYIPTKNFKNTDFINSGYLAVDSSGALVGAIPASELAYTEGIPILIPAPRVAQNVTVNVYIEYKSNCTLDLRGWTLPATVDFASFPSSSTTKKAFHTFNRTFDGASDLLLFITTLGRNDRNFTIYKLYYELVFTDAGGAERTISKQF